MDGDSLVITGVTKSSYGQYQCRAENIAGVRESPSVTLGVHEPPYFIKKPDPIKVAMVGGDLMLECVPDGDPLPRVKWFKQGQPGLLEMNKVR